MHNSSSTIGYINNNIEDVNFSFVPTTWQVTTGSLNNSSGMEIVVDNDVVDELYEGGIEDSEIDIVVDNFLVQEYYPEYKYIVKRYKSGFCELYIYIDSTKTYYISNVTGSGASLVRTSPYMRRNIQIYGKEIATIDSEVDSHKTNIKISLYNDSFTMDAFLGFEIHGNSLPLKIYKAKLDPLNDDGQEIQEMYQSRVLPSVAKHNGTQMWSYDSEEECYNF